MTLSIDDTHENREIAMQYGCCFPMRRSRLMVNIRPSRIDYSTSQDVKDVLRSEGVTGRIVILSKDSLRKKVYEHYKNTPFAVKKEESL